MTRECDRFAAVYPGRIPTRTAAKRVAGCHQPILEQCRSSQCSSVRYRTGQGVEATRPGQIIVALTSTTFVALGTVL